jgi:hypothetical protein
MRVLITATENEWKRLTEMASKNHNGRSLNHMISVQLNKRLSKIDVSNCDQVVEEETKLKKEFYIPPTLEKKVNCISKQLRVRPASLIRMMIIDPAIIDHFFGGEGH